MATNSTQGMMVLMGITITILGLLLSVYLKTREKRQKEYEEKRKIMEE